MARALIFDSGVGGLSVTGEIRALLPDLSLTYVADDEFRPYGEKSEHALRERLPQLLWVLCEMIHPDLVVVACNTASTSALGDIRNVLDIPVVGVVPAIKPGAKSSQTGNIGVLGTPGTVRRRYVDGLIHQFAQSCEVSLHGSVSLVKMAETKLEGVEPNLDHIRAEILPLLSLDEIDTIVLACTHFPLLIQEFKLLAPQINWIDSGAAIARRVRSLLPQGGSDQNGHDVAFLIGPDPSPARKTAFAEYGFETVIGLKP